MNGETPEAGGLGPDDPDHDGIRGWIPPDDRLWRHPSELASSGIGPDRPTGAADRSGRGGRGTWMVAGVVTCIAGALLVGGLLVAATGGSSGHGNHPASATDSSISAVGTSPTTEPGTAEQASALDIARSVSTVRSSLVALVVTGPSGTAWATGVVAEPGGIIATTAPALAGATSIAIIEPNGQRVDADMVATDHASGIAVLRVGVDLPVADFDVGDPAPGMVATAVAVVPGSGHAGPSPLVYAGTVRSSGTATNDDKVTTTFASTAVSVPLGKRQSGCPLLDSGGSISGLLETTTLVDGDTVADFLPAGLVLGVTRQLMATGTIDRGWLGIDASDQSPTGALVDAVHPGSGAATAGLQAGDVIVAVDGQVVHSMAELRSRLYAEVPGTAVSVTYRRGSSMATVAVVLAPATVTASSPRPAP